MESGIIFQYMKKVFFLVLISVGLVSCGTSKKKISADQYSSTYERKISKEEFKRKSDPAVKEKIDHGEKRIKESAIKEEVELSENQLALKIVDYAKSFLGTKYRYGGMSESGMDCSGLVYLSFLNAGDIFLPRSSREIAKQGEKIKLKQAQKGDLVFFRTNGRNVINHLGLVVRNDKGKVEFIHSSTTKGVMISALNEDYWNKNFVEARRIL